MLKPVVSHRFDLTPAEAVKLQVQLRSRVVREDAVGEIRTIAGVDVGFAEHGRLTRAAVAVMSYPALQWRDEVTTTVPTTFPYVPGLLSFRELPAVLAAIEKLTVVPDLILCDGQGYAHPRRFGIASHLGVLLDRPTIGVAKSRLVGEHAELGARRGDWVELTDRGEVIGAVVRTRANVRPLYISAGHGVSLPMAIHTVMQCVTRFRLPEPTRRADQIASARG